MATRFKLLGCNGDSGCDADLLNTRREAGSGGLLLCLLGVDGVEGFEASVSALRAALIMCVAKMVLSRVLIRSSSRAGAFFVVVPLEVVPLDFTVVPVLVVRAFDFVADSDISTSGRSRLLRVTTVAGVQVVIEETADLTASQGACNEAIGLCAYALNHIIAIEGHRNT